MLQKIMFIIFLIQTICKRVSFLKYALRSTSIIKTTVKKMALSPECFVCFWWDLPNWKEQSFNLVTGMEDITQLLKWNYLSGPNVSDNTNITLLPKRELLFFELVLIWNSVPYPDVFWYHFNSMNTPKLHPKKFL